MNAPITLIPGEERQSAKMWRFSTDDLTRQVETDTEHGLAAEGTRRHLNSNGNDQISVLYLKIQAVKTVRLQMLGCDKAEPDVVGRTMSVNRGLS